MTPEEIKQFSQEQVSYLSGQPHHTLEIHQIAKIVEIAIVALKNQGLLK